MRYIRLTAILILAVIAITSMLANYTAPLSYEQQFRETPDAAPSHQHLLGTDNLGRDRYSRLLYGTRVSLLLAPAAALLASLLAAVIGGLAGFFGGRLKVLVMTGTDLFLSLPWLFLLITVRAMLPFNVPPLLSVAITFALLGCLGWATAARVVCTDAHSFANSEKMLLLRASGIRNARILWRHMIPDLMPTLSAQFWISIPVFILTEANLGILGLGVTEPLPSWGSLLRELEGDAAFLPQPWQFIPLVLLILTVSCLQLVFHKKEASS